MGTRLVACPSSTMCVAIWIGRGDRGATPTPAALLPPPDRSRFRRHSLRVLRSAGLTHASLGLPSLSARPVRGRRRLHVQRLRYRQIRGNGGPAPGRADDAKVSAKCADPIGETAQAASQPAIGTPTAVVGDLDVEQCLVA